MAHQYCRRRLATDESSQSRIDHRRICIRMRLLCDVMREAERTGKLVDDDVCALVAPAMRKRHGRRGLYRMVVGIHQEHDVTCPRRTLVRCPADRAA